MAQSALSCNLRSQHRGHAKVKTQSGKTPGYKIIIKTLSSGYCASTIWRSLAVKGKNFGGRIAKLSVIVKI